MTRWEFLEKKVKEIYEEAFIVGHEGNHPDFDLDCGDILLELEEEFAELFNQPKEEI